MAFWKKLIGSGIKEGVDGVVGLAEGIKTILTGKLPPKEEAEIFMKLTELQNISNKMQSDVNAIEAQSSSLFVSGWRPAVGWICVFSLAFNFIIAPLLSALGLTIGQLDSGELMTLLFGLLGLSGMRSWEKKQRVAAS